MKPPMRAATASAALITAAVTSTLNPSNLLGVCVGDVPTPSSDADAVLRIVFGVVLEVGTAVFKILGGPLGELFEGSVGVSVLLSCVDAAIEEDVVGVVEILAG